VFTFSSHNDYMMRSVSLPFSRVVDNAHSEFRPALASFSMLVFFFDTHEIISK